MEVAVPGRHVLVEDALLRQYHVVGRGLHVEVAPYVPPPPVPNPGGLGHAYYLLGRGTLTDDGQFRQYAVTGFGVFSETTSATPYVPPTPPPDTGERQLALVGPAGMLNEDLLGRQYALTARGVVNESSQGPTPPSGGTGGPVVGARLAWPEGGLTTGPGRLARRG